MSEVNCERDHAFLGWAIETPARTYVFPVRVYRRDYVAFILGTLRREGHSATARVLTQQECN